MDEKDLEQMQGSQSGEGTEPPKEKPKTKRDTLHERIAKKYPDKTFDDDESYASQINDDYDEYDRQIADYKKNEQALADMYASDPRSASFLMEWKEGSDPIIALIRNYGSDVVAAADDPERQEEMAQANKEYLERVNKNKQLEKEYKENLQQSLQQMDDAQQQYGWSDEQIDSAFQNLFQIVNDAVMGKFTPETIQLMMNAQNYEKDLANAQQEGEVRGRNAKIEEKLRKQKSGDGTVHLDGKNGNESRKPSQQSMFALAAQAQ